MSDKKNIDRLFQEKFKDFEVEPREHVWINIDAALREKKKRRIIPIWFKTTGIAAGLILGFFAFSFLFDNPDSTRDNPIVIGTEKELDTNNPLQKNTEANTSVANTENPDNSNNRNTDITVDPENASSINQKTNVNDVPAVANQNKSSERGNNKLNSGLSSEKSNAVATSSAQPEESPTKKKTRTSLATGSGNQTEGIAGSESSKSVQKKKTSVTGKNTLNTLHPLSDEDKNNATVLQTKTTTEKNRIKNTPAEEILTEKDQNHSIAENPKSAVEQNTLIKDNFPTDILTEEVIKKDSTALAVEPNALEELLKKNEEEKKMIAEAKINRWQISSNVAPIYFNSTSNGSPIDAQFADNNKSYENNLSFGVGINYAISKKISVRTGVNKFTLGYSTNDVVFFAAMEQMSFGNVASSPAGSTIQVVSESNTAALNPFQFTNEGVMTQRMGYFEVPLEMSYKLIDKKFGVNLIGGMSTLFLNENEVSVSSAKMSASLGKAKNLNDIHFSTNIGVGFRYRFWKSFEANFEPMFKYQINTFTKDAGNFKPYFIGLYSGVSFNF